MKHTKLFSLRAGKTGSKSLCRLIGRLGLAASFIATTQTVTAEPDTAVVHYASKKYVKENAVYLNVTRRLVIESDNGKLTAHTEETLQKMFLTDRAPGLYGREDLSYTYLNDLDGMPTGTAYVPTDKGYKRIRCTNFGAFHPADEGIFYDDNKGVAVLYSGLTKNSITETRYSLDCSELSILPSLFFFQNNLPITKCNVEIVAPYYVDLGFVLKGSNTGKVKQTKEEKGGKVTYRFTYNDVPSIKNVEGVPSPLYFVPHLVPYIKSYVLPNDYRTKKVMAGQDALYKYLYKYIKNINVAQDKELNKTVETLIKNDVTPRQKAVHIYDWVQKNLHYVAFEDSLGGFYPRQAGTINQRKFGDCKDMTSVLVAMFRKAGLNAYFTWIGTRHLPYDLSETPVPVFDHMICTVKIDDEWIFVDGTDPYIPFGKYPDGDQGKEAVIGIDAENYKILKVPIAEAAENTTNDSTFIHILSYKSISGTAVIRYAGSKAYTMAAINTLTRDEQRDRVMRAITARGNDKYLLDKHNIDIAATADRNAEVTATYNNHDYIQKVKGQYMVNMNITRYLTDTWIDTTGRDVPYFFNNKEKVKEVVVLELPKGGGVAHLPAPVRGTLGNVLSYSMTYAVRGRQVILTKVYELKSRSVGKKDFAAYNRLIDNLNKHYKESVVLTGK